MLRVTAVRSADCIVRSGPFLTKAPLAAAKAHRGSEGAERPRPVFLELGGMSAGETAFLAMVGPGAQQALSRMTRKSVPPNHVDERAHKFRRRKISIRQS